MLGALKYGKATYAVPNLSLEIQFIVLVIQPYGAKKLVGLKTWRVQYQTDPA